MLTFLSPFQLALAAGAVFLVLFYLTGGLGLVFHALFLFLLGAVCGGTDVVLSTSVAIDIGIEASMLRLGALFRRAWG